MDLLKEALDWAKAEVFSASFFVLFGIAFLIATYGFWQMGKTDFAKSFLYPTMVAGILLLAIGVGLVYSNKTRINNFPKAHQKDATAFLQEEVERVEKTMSDFERILFKIIPLIIVIAALVIVFVNKPLWQAIGITTIAFMVILLLVDSNSYARLAAYHKQLMLIQ